MKVLDSGHAYKLSWFDGFPEVAGIGSRPNSSLSEDVLIFMKREGSGYPGNVGHHGGTNLQEVLRACIDRVKYLDNQIPCEENGDIIADLRHALWSLEKRAAVRHKRLLTILDIERLAPEYEIEKIPTCPRCGHIGCVGECAR